MIVKLIEKLIGDPNQKIIKKLKPTVEKINQIASEYQNTLTDADFPKKTAEFKERLKNGENLDDLLPEAFALVKDACRRLVGQTWQVRGRDYTWDIHNPFDVQLVGGIILHRKNIAEMKTGEGKTLVCTLPLYLNALTEKGVFLVTVNDYLAHRDAEWMGGLYRFLGLSVGIIHHGQSIDQKKTAYNCDIIYGTNNEFGFDYLRDNMATSLENCVQRHLYYAIIDEVDSILIDEARTPLIISAAGQESTSKYQKYARLVNQLQENTHYNIDEKVKTATLSEEGITTMEQLLGVENIYTEGGFTEVHHIEQALKAKGNYKRDVDYVVKDDEIIIVDEFTGRLMPGRRYSQGLHQAIEAKENVQIKQESRTLATITFQNYFRLFEKLAGMTGTAVTEAEEFYKIYGLDVIVIPTNRKLTRSDKTDLIYKNERGKFLAITEETKKLHKAGQPVLIGTISIEKSEMLSKLLSLHGVPHNVLNAKQHEREAEIIARAGEKAAVTIATNMAGRGTDIKLAEEVKELGGLAVIGSERHESRRIDNQLRGRSGRQGDPGLSQFYVSLEDSLMRLFGSERIKSIMERLGIPEDQAIENRLISRSIENAQKKVEGHNFDIRKHLVEYDDVMNRQRGIIYKRRRKILEVENVKNDILVLIEKEIEAIALNHTAERERRDWNIKEIFETTKAIHLDPSTPIAQETLEQAESTEQIIDILKNYLWKEYHEREQKIIELLPDGYGNEAMRQMERNTYLRVIDTLWMEHIDTMSKLRQNVALVGYGQRDPLVEYKSRGFELFQELIGMIQTNTVNTLFKMKVTLAPAQQTATPKQAPSEIPQNLQTNEQQIEKTISETSLENHNNFNNHDDNLDDDSGPTVIRHISANEPAPTQPDHDKVGRNEPCPCGSSKKYKKCHGKTG